MHFLTLVSPTGGSGGGGGGDESASTASSDVSGGGGSGKGGAPSAGGGGKPPKEEPEVIREWKQRQVAALEKKDADEEEAKLDLRQQAKKELESWYKQHNEQVTQSQSTTDPSAGGPKPFLNEFGAHHRLVLCKYES